MPVRAEGSVYCKSRKMTTGLDNMVWEIIDVLTRLMGIEVGMKCIEEKM